MYDENKVLEENFERQSIVLRFSEMTNKQLERALKNGNISSIPMRKLSLRFITLVARYACLTEEAIPNCPMIPFEFDDHLYSLSYTDGTTMLNCHRCDIRPDELNRVEKAWNSVFENVRKYQGKEFYTRFREGSASIVNHYSEDISQLEQMEEEIDKYYSPSSNMDEKRRNNAILLWELMAPRKVNYHISFKIKTYILSFFSFLEYLANCILPFWNEMKIPEWNRFIEICGYKNDKVKTWMDLYDPEKTKVKTTSSQNKKEERPEDISIVDVFFSSLPEAERKLVEEYRELKKSYRNVLAHGELGKLNLHGLSPIHRDLDTNNGNAYYEGFFVEDMDRHAYLRIKRFSKDFLDMIQRLYPTVMLFLKSEQDIPGRPTEFVSNCWNDCKKAEAYLKEMRLRDIYDYFEWRVDAFRPTKEEVSSLVADFAEMLSDFNPYFEIDDNLPEILNKLILVENKYLVQFDRYCAIDGDTGLVHYGKREELEAGGTNWEDFVNHFLDEN